MKAGSVKTKDRKGKKGGIDPGPSSGGRGCWFCLNFREKKGDNMRF